MPEVDDELCLFGDEGAIARGPMNPCLFGDSPFIPLIDRQSVDSPEHMT
jgi:hypothetical protein